MRAVVFDEPGAAEALRLDEVAEPALTAPDQVRIRMLAAGVNPVDTKVRAGGMIVPGAPRNTPGCDGVGIIEECGSAVHHARPGQRVAFCFGGVGADPGTYAEQVVVPEAAVVPVPAAVSDAQAAALPLTWLTAWEALFERADLQRGQSVLVHAAAGGVGQMAVQIARAAGGRVLGLVRRDEAGTIVSALGGDVVDLRKPDAADAIMQYTDGRGFDIVLDTVGGEVFREGLTQVAYGGDLVTLLAPPADTDWNPARLRNPSISLELMLTPMLENDRRRLKHQATLVAEGLARLASGRLQVNVEDTLPLAEAAEAHRRIEAGGRRGKLVLRIPE
ncbi:zinc-binding dehydrogenase [Thioalkalivibrio sp. AKL12]|uniref:zinc-binding dehydrogenase n=1 Tax=Thioalkalivibrio sp. AKL12 TaxID=1158159 RepID=UPI00038017B9|nr:zinc-binding dehydrogenase [Thioalkalivibrio sp. AKL12]